MLLGLVRAMLGPLAPILDWAEAHPNAVALCFAIWGAIWGVGKIQLNRTEKETRALVLELGRNLLAKKPGMSARALYEAVYPDWARSVRKWALFIPHRLELWPVLANPENLKERIGFTPEWVKGVLEDEGLNRRRGKRPAEA